jgi:hypothetical protein
MYGKCGRMVRRAEDARKTGLVLKDQGGVEAIDTPVASRVAVHADSWRVL